MSGPGPILLYDGVCGLCDRTVRFVLRRDRHDVFRFAPLQSPFAASVLSRHGRDPARLDTVILVLHPGEPAERLLIKSRAALSILRELGGAWRLAACVLGILPTPLLNLGYDLVARVRYRLFGKLDACALPSPEQRHKFLGD